MDTKTYKGGGVLFVLSFALLMGGLVGLLVAPVGQVESADAAGTTKIVVTRVNHDRALISGTRANVDKSISAAGSLSINPATFTNILAGSHSVSVSKKYASMTLRNVKMCTQVDVNTTCSPNTPVTFTCNDVECTTSKITTGSLPVRVQAQYSSGYPVR